MVKSLSILEPLRCLTCPWRPRAPPHHATSRTLAQLGTGAIHDWCEAPRIGPWSLEGSTLAVALRCRGGVSRCGEEGLSLLPPAACLQGATPSHGVIRGMLYPQLGTRHPEETLWAQVSPQPDPHSTGGIGMLCRGHGFGEPTHTPVSSAVSFPGQLV